MKTMYYLFDNEIQSFNVLTKYEMNYALKNLEKHNNTVDFIITHDAPSSDCILLNRSIKINPLNIFLEDIRANCNYKHWYFGHHHKNRHINNLETCVYDKIIQIA